jgi:hypothetical protein
MNWGFSLKEKPDRRSLYVFLLLSCLGILFVFRAAPWGAAILAPLDTSATLYTKYRWIDPASGQVPNNHYTIDIVDYDLPLNYLAHRSLQIGEFPWWNPYCEGGRTLAMEPHLGLTDPLRLLLLQLPDFVMGYNWTRLLQCFFSGLTMFALLRYLGFSQFITILGALSFQFCGFQTSFFCPNVHGLFYYPLLWLILAKHGRTRPVAALALGGLVCGLIIAGGSQQSHPYLVLFLGCFVTGYGSCFRRELPTLLLVAGGAFLIGCAMAAPVLIPQLEIFALSSRKVPQEGLGAYMLTGVFSTAGIFPWFTGSFRTLDIGKLLEQSGAAYAVYMGTPVMMLAVIGLVAGRKSPRAGSPEVRTAMLLVLLYFVGICSTPLLRVLYYRSVILALPGLIILFGAGFELLIENAWPNARRIVRWIVLLLSTGLVATHLFAFIVYPRIKDKILTRVLARDTRNRFMPSSPELRRFQVENLPNEITFKNSEPLLAFLGALSLLLFATTHSRRRQFAAAAMFTCNLLPLLIFSTRVVPYSPVKYWNAILAGGPEQTKIIEAAGRDLRLLDRAPSRLDYVLPGTMPSLYGVHSMGGYTSFPLVGPGQAESPRDYNILYVSEKGLPHGKLTVLHTNQVRFLWETNQTRDVSIVKETPNSIRLRIEAGPPGDLVRTDTYYPGWHAENPRTITQRRNAQGFLAFSIPAEATDLVLRYRPSHHKATRLLCIASMVLTAGLLLLARRPRLLDQASQARPG